MFAPIALQANTSTGTAVIAGAAFLLATYVVLATYIIFIIGGWRVFEKADRPGWWSIIPVWNVVVLMQITGRSGW